MIHPVRAGRRPVAQTRSRAAIKTPYLPNGKFDLEAYDAMVEQQLQSGVEGLIVGGTTGEGQLMSWDEHIMLIAHTGCGFGAVLVTLLRCCIGPLLPALLHASFTLAGFSLLRLGAVNQFGRQIKVIGNTGSNSTREALHATEQVGAAASDAPISSDPAVHRPAAGDRAAAPRAARDCVSRASCNAASLLQGFAVGMDAALQINPYYGKTSMTGLTEHFK